MVDDHEVVGELTPDPELDALLLGRGWDRAAPGMWRWVPSLTDTPDTAWDITTVLWDGRRIFVGVVGDDLQYAHVRDDVAELAAGINALERMRYVP